MTSLPNILYAQTTLPIDGKLKTFEFKKIGIDYYQTNWFNVNSQNCFDLYSNKSYLPNSYLGTGCFKIYYLIDKGQKRIYSLNSRVYVDFSYSGDPILILTAGPLFDRKETLLKQKAITANPKGERVSYFTYDFQVRNRHFSNLEYYVSGVMVSSDLDYLNSQICDFQKAQLHRTLNQTLPSGGEFITYNKKVGYCTFLYNSPYFLFGYLSHAPMVARINNQILPTLTLTPSPTNTPTPKTTKTPTPTKKLTPTRIPLPTKTPTRRPIPTRKPRKPTLTPVEKYHSECRRFLFSKYCVLVKGPGINQCRTSRDCR